METVKEYFILGKFCVRKKARIFIHNEMRTEEVFFFEIFYKLFKEFRQRLILFSKKIFKKRLYHLC